MRSKAPLRPSPCHLFPTLLAILLTSPIAGPSFAAAPFPLGDLFTEQSQGSSSPESFAEINGITLFDGSHPTLGKELWRTDGTPAGTWILLDIYPGETSSFPAELTRFGDWIYFTAVDHSFGRELWRTQGTAESTELVIDIYPGTAFSSPRDLTVLGDELIFSANSDGTGRELWKVPAAGPPEIIVDLVPGFISSSPDDLVAVGSSYVAFAVTSATGDNELGISDGTAAGTVIYDINPSGDSNGRPLGSDSDSLLYFQAFTNVSGREVWSMDPGEGTWRLISDTMPGSGSSFPLHPIVRDKTLLVNLDTPEGRKLFMSREGGAVEEVAALDAAGFELLGDDILFVADGDLWSTSGLTPGARKLASANILPFLANGRLKFLVPFFGQAYFFADGGLWSSDGTGEGTGLIEPMAFDSMATFQPGDSELFATIDDGAIGAEPWVFDGQDFRLLKDLYTQPTHSDPREFTATGAHLYFSANVDGSGRELLYWSGDGPETGQGAQLVEDLYPGPDGSRPEELMAAGTKVYFQAETPSLGVELTMVEDPAAGAAVIDLEPGAQSSNTEPFAPLGSEVFFGLRDDDGIWQLWITEDDAQVQLTSFSGGSSGLELVTPAILDGTLFFVAGDDVAGDELWRSDGTTTEMVEDLFPGLATSFPRDLVVSGGWLYWRAVDPSNSFDLWRTDSDALSLSRVTDLATPLLGLGSLLLMTKEDSDIGDELWVTDGTEEGTDLLRDAWPGDEDGLVDDSPPFGASNGEPAFFSAIGPTTGEELWTTDGTSDLTFRLRDLVPGPTSSAPHEFTALPDGDFLFTAYTPEAGWELWRSNGSALGTTRVSDIVPGPLSSEPRDLTLFRDWVVFSALSQGADREPWAYNWTIQPYIFGDDFESADLSSWSLHSP